ncbi:TadE family type IV pilus minor pilin [Sinosporangium siamense]|uniref:TadE family type IV pilus minor pilin n=1 Tax=Sinosporangium siamense TaxID=1367973 RepID=UPI0035E777D2
MQRGVQQIACARGRGPRARSRGSVTAETAVVFPSMVVVLGVSLWMINVVEMQLRCVDAARAGARAIARGEPPDRVRQAMLAALPADAHTTITRDNDTARVRISVDVRPTWGGALPVLAVHATAVSPLEPGELP